MKPAQRIPQQPVDRIPFEKSLANFGLKAHFDARLPVAQVFGGTEEEIWLRNAREFGWHENWRDMDGVHIPFGVPFAKGTLPTPASSLADATPAPKVRDKRINADVATDRESLLRWTAAAIGTDPDEIHPDDIPSSAHVAMLRFANDDSKTFWGWIDELDKRKAKEAESGKSFRDDKRRLFSVMDAIEEDRERTARLATSS